MKTYCMSLYGCPLWDLEGKHIQRFYVAWRKGLRKLLGLPYNTHCNLLNLICDDIPVDCQLDNRLLKFMSSCSLSENIVVKLCYKLACNGSQSTMCNNIYFLCAKYGICRSVLCQGSRCYKGLSYQSSDTCKLYEIKASVIRDMLNTIEANRLGNNYITGFTTDDANDLLSTLCTD